MYKKILNLKESQIRLSICNFLISPDLVDFLLTLFTSFTNALVNNNQLMSTLKPIGSLIFRLIPIIRFGRRNLVYLMKGLSLIRV